MVNILTQGKVKQQHTFPIIECFGPTLQGEGAMIGKITHFIRLGGCDFSCSWCDSMHAVTPSEVRSNAKWLTVDDIIDKIQKIGHSKWVTISGGNPALFGLNYLIDELHTFGYSVAIETQGSIFKEWMSKCDVVTVSPKGPSSGMVDRFNIEPLRKIIHCNPSNINIKIVIFDNEDLLFASNLYQQIGDLVSKWFISIGTRPKDSVDDILTRWREIAETVMYRCGTLSEFTILPQAHVLLYGHGKGV